MSKSYSVSFNMVGKKSCISQNAVWKLHVNTYVNDVFKRDNSESVPIRLLETDNVGDRVPQYFIKFTNMLTGHCQFRNYSSTGHSWIIPDHKKHFSLSVTDAVSLLVSNGVIISSEHSFVCSGVECGSSNLEPWEKWHFRNWLHAQKP